MSVRIEQCEWFAAPPDRVWAAVEDISADYTPDVAHSRLGFSARHAMVTTVRGAFKDFDGTATIDSRPRQASRWQARAGRLDWVTGDRSGVHRTDAAAEGAPAVGRRELMFGGGDDQDAGVRSAARRRRAKSPALGRRA